MNIVWVAISKIDHTVILGDTTYAPTDAVDGDLPVELAEYLAAKGAPPAESMPSATPAKRKVTESTQPTSG